MEPSDRRPERRTEARYPANEYVTFRVLPQEDKRPAKIVNVSRSGLLLELSEHLPMGAQIEVLTLGGVIFGEVRFSHPVPAGFQAGVRIDDAFFSSRSNHIAEDSLILYAQGRGLHAHELVRIAQHLDTCDSCNLALAQVVKDLKALMRAKET